MKRERSRSGRRRAWRGVLTFAALLAPTMSLSADPADPAGEVFFESRVRPLLVKYCHSCHGSKRQKSGLRLDSRASVLEGGDSGPAIILRDAARSLLVRAVTHVDEDLRMPPKKKLDDAEIATLIRWVAIGAPWPKDDGLADSERTPIERLAEIRGSHWAFQPISRPEVPGGVGSEIDRFVGRALADRDLSPSPRAEPRALLRRVYLDLIGLPPTFDEVSTFVADSSPAAFARVVDELLERPEYGERWGRHWLDVARYGDTKGYVDAGERKYPFAWTYRDWVTRAFNEDLPFDRFVLQQIAADRVDEGARPRSLAALGFLNVGSRFNFFPHEMIDDRIDVVTRGLMGLTLACARCHDHKYDPLGVDDYYGLYGIFASSREPSPDELPRLDGSTSEVAKELVEKAKAYKDRRRQLHVRIQHEMRAWATDYLDYIVQLMPRHRTRAQPLLRTKRGLVRDVSAYARGAVIRWRRFIAECGPEHPVFGVWNRLVELEPAEVAARAREIANVEPPLFNALVVARLREGRVKSMAEVATTLGDLLEETERLWRDRVKTGKAAPFESAAREQLRAVLYGDRSPAVFTIDESEDLYTLDESVDVRGRFAAIERVYLKQAASPARAMATVDRAQPIEPRVLVRGDPDRPGRRVARRFPRLLEAVDSRVYRLGSGRLELARAIVDRSNPLTARVIVNRIWSWHFGSGLVSTPSDFGVRSEPPSHPELLDWLAWRLVEDGWSMKKLHRRILASHTWQQSSVDRPSARAIDVENRMLWRMNRQRLDLEAMRDSMLRVAGRLQLGYRGRPVDTRIDDPSGKRRTMYLHVGRELLEGLFRVFDFPSPDLSSAQRPRTTVPQQALFLLNSPFVIAQADSLASRTDDDAHDVAARVGALYRLVHARDPSAREIGLASLFVASGEKVRDEPTEVVRPSAWSYGYGEFDAKSRRLRSFTPLPHFSGEHWQGGASYPDSKLQYLQLTATGGHVGVSLDRAAVRRWTAPVDGVISISGELAHVEEDCGDGVRGRVVSSRAGVVGEWTVYKGRRSANVDRVEVKKGDTVDFVVDCRKNHSCDVFGWAPTLQLVAAVASGPKEWSAREEFGDVPTVLAPSDPWADLAQVLLQSNEFLFVD